MSNGTRTIVQLVDCRMTAETILASAANSFAIPAASLAIIFCWPVTFVNKGLRLRSPLPSTNSPNHLTLPPSLRGDVQIYTAPRPYEGMRR